MSNLGLGVMIQMLGGNAETVAAVNYAVGKRIESVSMCLDTLEIELNDGRSVHVSDEGQSCCERRYMTCDDDLPSFAGATIAAIETRDVPPIADDDNECHDVQFLVVTTDKGAITCSTHNEHNGYYGGFSIQARLQP